MSWTDDLNDEERDTFQEFVTYQREHTLKEMESSAFVMSLVPDKDKIDIMFSVELGMAIMLDKPILALVMPGAEVPPKLRLVADEIIQGDFDTAEGRQEMLAVIDRMMTRIRQSDGHPPDEVPA